MSLQRLLLLINSLFSPWILLLLNNKSRVSVVIFSSWSHQSYFDIITHQNYLSFICSNRVFKNISSVGCILVCYQYSGHPTPNILCRILHFKYFVCFLVIDVRNVLPTNATTCILFKKNCYSIAFFISF
ncbi:hypothetical protein PRUPE_6G349700 [Prunus persica]|uniref:Secreted protein n=1 Tax=Prunus persica TaxID=3760 RepID=A0A251P3K9_PRUPE|nr:hypothetical protein PRUPE_6G349700 [Prunus persica]